MTQRIGLIGCGTISEIYLRNASYFKGLEFVACADLLPVASKSTAAAHSIDACSVETLLRRDDVDIVLNLTTPEAHVEISLSAIEAGKHVYTEKPIATSVCDGKRILNAAAEKGLRIGCAPDTILGASIQTARSIVASGEIGRPILGSAAILSHGMEMWHPNPSFFFKRGAGPVLDMGPYAIASLVTLLGPITSVVATGQIGNAERIITSPNSKFRGQTVQVDILTSVQALLDFETGAQVSFVASWDVWNHNRAPIEIHGTIGSLILPNLNWFGGDLSIARLQSAWETISTDAMVFGVRNYETNSGCVANYRGLGLADMAFAIETGHAHRASGALGLHVLTVMEAILASAESRETVLIDAPFNMSEAFTEEQAKELLNASHPSSCQCS